MSDDLKVPVLIDSMIVDGILNIPEAAKGIVIFVHGSGSSRLSPRNQYVAKELQNAGFATLLFDLLSEQEEAIRESRFDIELLTERLIQVTQWIRTQEVTKDLRIGYFGASTGAAAALKAGAKLGHKIKAIVSRGGRPDLAMDDIYLVYAPSLLIVGGDDVEGMGMNQTAFEAMKCEKKLEILPGATHLFEESGKLEEVARLAVVWFTKHVPKM